MSYLLNYTDFDANNLIVSVDKEQQMTDTKTGKQLAYRTGELQYVFGKTKTKLVMKGPECDIPGGVYINDNKDDQPQQQVYQQPTINGGYSTPQMFNPSQIAPMKSAYVKRNQFSSRIALSFGSDKVVNEKHNELGVVVSSETLGVQHKKLAETIDSIDQALKLKLFDIRNIIYLPNAVQGQQMVHKPLLTYPVDAITQMVNLDADPCIWTRSKRKEEDLNRIFMMPDRSYVPYKKLQSCHITGIPIFEFKLFFNQLNRTCKAELVGFIIKEIKISQVANDMINIANTFAEQDPEAITRMNEALSKINQVKTSDCEESSQVQDLPVDVVPPTVTIPQTYIPPQTPQQTPQPPYSYLR